MFKNQVEPRAHCKVLNILTSFLWSIRVQTVKNCCRFVFDVSRKIQAKEKENELRHHRVISMVLQSYRSQLLTNQRAKNRSVIIKKRIFRPIRSNESNTSGTVSIGLSAQGSYILFATSSFAMIYPINMTSQIKLPLDLRRWICCS